MSGNLYKMTNPTTEEIILDQLDIKHRNNIEFIYFNQNGAIIL